jgi:hypothetical protein
MLLAVLHHSERRAFQPLSAMIVFTDFPSRIVALFDKTRMIFT